MARTKITTRSTNPYNNYDILHRKDREHIKIWLQTNRLLCDNQTNDFMLSQCFKLFIDSFGYQQLLLLITKASNIKQLQSMYKIITKQKRDIKEKKQCEQLNHANKQNNMNQNQ
eukprot:93362_1